MNEKSVGLRAPAMLGIASGLLLVVALFGFTGCSKDEAPGGSPNAETPQRGGSAVIGSITDMDSWNEYVSRQSFAHFVLRRIFLRLAHEREAGGGSPESYGPALAQSWDRSEDGLSITFRLRDTVWSDGRPITADDVRFTWQAQTSEHVPWTNGEAKERIRDVVVEDERTVTFQFDREYPYQLSDAVEGGILPLHVFGQIPFEEWATHDWSRHSIGSGPFLLERHEPGQEIVLRRNPNYHQADYPLLDRVVVRVVPDVLSLLTQLRSGEIDLLLNVPPRDAYRIASDPDSPIRIVTFDTPRYEYLGWNCARPPFDDPMVRRAITLAIDRDSLVEDLVYEYGTVSSRPVPSSWWGAADGVEPWPYDPDEARAILQSRGYVTDTVVGVAAGRETRLEFDLVTNAGNRLREDTLIKIQEQLSRVGIKANVRTLEQRTLIQQASGGDFDGYLGGWNFVGKVPLKILFGSSYVPPNGFNVVRYHVPEVDDALDDLDLASDWQEMKPFLDAIQERIHEDQPYTFLFERQGIAAYGPRLQGVIIDIPSDPLARLERFWVASP